MRAESRRLLDQARADACSARDAPTDELMVGGLRDCVTALAVVAHDDTEAQVEVSRVWDDRELGPLLRRLVLCG